MAVRLVAAGHGATSGYRASLACCACGVLVALVTVGPAAAD